MVSVPGNVGMRFVSDKSLSFYQDAVGFSQALCHQYNSNVVSTQILSMPTVIVTSNKGTENLLKGV